MIIKAADFDYGAIGKIKPLKRKQGNQGSKRKVTYLDVICAFDIETTRIPEIEQAIMYIWQFQIGHEYTVIGRTWEEYREFIDRLDKAMKPGTTLMIYVHNLSHEFCFLKGIYDFQSPEIFAMDTRKILKCSMKDNRFEYRCSYILTNMSLKQFTEKMDVEHKKLPDYEYTEMRYPWTELTEHELEYCCNDVIGLVEAVEKLMERDGDNLYTIPMTSTGYVRRMVKAAMRTENRDYIKSLYPEWEVYRLLKQAFRGGNTHSNRYYTDFVIPQVVHSADRSSSYPEVMVNGEFPVSPFKHTGPIPLEEVHRLISSHKAILMVAVLRNISLKDKYWGCPYLSKDKSRSAVKYHDCTIDNGRIVDCDGEIEVTITDIDLKIIESEYNAEIIIKDSYISRYGKLPQPLIDVVNKLYTDKTRLKGVSGQEQFYMKSKNLLNSCYGMMATDCCRPEFIFKDLGLGYKELCVSDEKSMQDLLDSGKKNAFLVYQWGVWVTALARYELERGLQLAHKDGAAFVYADTDSVKYIGKIDWTEYNREKVTISEQNRAYADDPSGKRHYMGVFEQEEDYDANGFRTLGAKKYAGLHNGKLEITVAGVNKKKGAEELNKYGGLNALKDGFIFVEAGGLEALYNDLPDIREYKVDGHTIPIISNMVLRPSTYTVGKAWEYKYLLSLTKKDTIRIFEKEYGIDWVKDLY